MDYINNKARRLPIKRGLWFSGVSYKITAAGLGNFANPSPDNTPLASLSEWEWSGQ